MQLEQRTARKMVGCGVDAFPGADNADPMGDHTRMQTSNSKKNGCGVDAFPRANNADPMGDHTRTQTANSKKTSNSKDIPSVLTKDSIFNNPKYRHLFSGIGHFKWSPVKIEMKPNGEPVRNALRRVLPLALKDKFTKEIQPMMESGILF